MRSTEYINWKKKKLDLYFKPHAKMNSTYTVYLNVKSETLKLSEVNIGKYCYNFGVNQHFVKHYTEFP